MRIRRNRRARVVVVLGAGLVACGFSKNLQPGSEEIDAPIMLTCDAPTLSCADSVTLRASCQGAADVTTKCGWGCLDDAPGPRCGAVVPAGGGVEPADLDEMSLVDLAVTGTVNGSTGEINGAAASTLGVVFRLGSNNIAVFRVKDLEITGPLDLQGARAVAFVATGAVTVSGVVDARGTCASGANRAAGPGGFGGGDEDDGGGTGGGQGGNTPNRGAGGGGHGALGGAGGGAVPGGIVFGMPEVPILFGGAGGGGAKTSRGGGGGGAFQIVSNKSITIAVGGGINAGGCGALGGDGNADAGGGGGGAGGTILLEAPSITIAGALAVNGGGGGNRDNGDGSAGTLDRTQSTAPTGGGRGAAGAILIGDAGTGAGNNQTNGGGGGGIGRIRLNTGTGATTELVRTGVLSPDLTDPLTTTTHARAKVR